MIVRKLLPTDWPRFEYYSRKIRKLVIQNSKRGMVDKSFFTALTAYRPVRNPFPNLRHITMDFAHPLAYEAAPYIDFLLSPNIMQISITGVRVHSDSTREVSHISLLLPSIPRLCPNIQTLMVGRLPNKLVLGSAVFQAICSMHSLRTLDLGRLKPPDGMIGRILHHLGSLTSLKALHNLYITTEIQSSLDEPDCIPPPFGMVNHWWFPELRDLSLNVQDFDSAALVMDLMQQLPFCSLTFDLFGQPFQPHSPDKLLQSLARNPHLQFSLSTLSIRMVMTDTLIYDVGDTEIPRVFQPLLALTNLHELTLQLSGVEMLDDAWLNQASKCLPQLRVLSLYNHTSERRRITLAGYVALLRNCPGLRSITVSSAFKPFNTRKALPAGLCNENITKLNCWGSSIESSVIGIFRCLILMFPNLSHLVIPLNPQSEAGRKAWTFLGQLVRESQKY